LPRPGGAVFARPTAGALHVDVLRLQSLEVKVTSEMPTNVRGVQVYSTQNLLQSQL